MTVLMLGRNLELALYRAEVLRNAGHTVTLPKDKQEAMAAIRGSASGKRRPHSPRHSASM